MPVALVLGTLIGIPAAPAGGAAGPSAALASGTLDGVSCTAASTCTAVGSTPQAVGPFSSSLAEGWDDAVLSDESPSADPTTTGAFLQGVSCVTATACVAVGGNAFGQGEGAHAEPLAEVWDGSTWDEEAPGDTPAGTTAWLSGVSCPSAGFCMAVGQVGPSYLTEGEFSVAPLADSMDGGSWTSHPAPVPAGSTAGALDGVSCTSATACVAVGTTTDASGTWPLVEVWNGTAWAIAAVSAPTGATAGSLAAVSCTSAASCVAVGSFTTSTGADPALGGPFVPLVAQWDGTAWTSQSAPVPAGAATAALTGLSCTSPTACVAVGSSSTTAPGNAELYSPVAETWNGASWSVQTTPSAFSTSSLSGVSCTAATACVAVGWSQQDANQPVTLTMAWDGSAWRAAPTVSDSPVTAVAGSDAVSVAGSGWGGTGDPSVEFYECTTPSLSTDCSPGLGAASVGGDPADAGTFSAAVTLPPETLLSPAGGCDDAAPPNVDGVFVGPCYLVTVGTSSDDQVADPLDYPTGPGAPYDGYLFAGQVVTVGSGGFPAGDPVTATECALVGGAPTQCDAATARRGVAGADGTVQFTPPSMTIEPCAGQCVVRFTDEADPTVTASVDIWVDTLLPLDATVPANTVEKVSASVDDFLDPGDIVTATECDSSLAAGNAAEHCDAATTVSGTVSRTGHLGLAGPRMLVGSAFDDPAGGTCAPGTTCAVEFDVPADGLVFDVPVAIDALSATVAKTTAVPGNTVDHLVTGGFPVGDTVTATECDATATTADLARACDGATGVTGTVARSGRVAFAPGGLRVTVGDGYADPGGGACDPGATCQIAFADRQDPALDQLVPITMATPTLTVSVSGRPGARVLSVRVTGAPAGDPVVAEECDTGFTLGASDRCDAGTAVDGAAKASGTVAGASWAPEEMTELTGGAYVDPAGGHCDPGDTCAVGFVDQDNPALSALTTFTAR